MYSIKDLEALSNVKAHTIRIWEQRYHMFNPDRSATNIRLYTDNDLRHLLNVCTLINMGIRVSRIGKLSTEEIGKEIDRLIASSAPSDALVSSIINEIIIAVSEYDANRFLKLFNKAVKIWGLEEAYKHVFYPLLTRTGLLWQKSDIMPAQEHFLSNQIRQQLFAAINRLPIPEESDQTWLLFLNEHEKHELGLLFAYFLLRKHGKKVIYLGQEVPYDNLRSVVNQCKPSHLYSFFTRRQSPEEVNALISKLCADFNDNTICVSGKEEIIKSFPAQASYLWIKDIDALLNLTQNQDNEKK